MNINEELMQVAVGEVQKDDALLVTEWIFANKENPALFQLFHSLYHAVHQNKIGVAHCKNRADGSISTLIVGVEETEEGTQLYPLARILNEGEMEHYLAPDGNGGYVGE